MIKDVSLTDAKQKFPAAPSKGFSYKKKEKDGEDLHDHNANLNDNLLFRMFLKDELVQVQDNLSAVDSKGRKVRWKYMKPLKE